MRKAPKTNLYGEKGWRLPPAVFRRAKYLVRDYPRIKAEYDRMLTATPDHDGAPGGSGPGDPTGALAVRLAALSDDIRAVERAMKKVPSEYRKDICRHIVEGRRYPDYAGRVTWGYWQQVFLYHVAIFRGY